MTVLLPLEFGHLTSLDEQTSLQVESSVVEEVQAQQGGYSLVLCKIELDRPESWLMKEVYCRL